jgi:ribosome-associated protein
VRLAPGVRVRRSDLRVTAVRSEGPGGQNVNKRSTRVQLRVHVADLHLPEGARKRLEKLAGSSLTQDGELIIASGQTRSQSRNREDVVERLAELVKQAMVRPKPRRATKPSKAAKRRRVDEKKQRGEIKQRRKPPRPDERR